MIDFIEYRSTLAYYDGPEVFDASDRIGGNYIGMMLDSDVQAFKILVVGVAQDHLMRLRRGDIDLRSAILAAAEYGWYLCETDTLEGRIPISDRRTGAPTESMLPDENYYLSDPVDNQNAAMVTALERSNFVVSLKIEPINLLTPHRLKLKDYGDLISRLNSLISDTKLFNSSAQEPAEIPPADLDIVTPATSGSLVVLLEASSPDNDIFRPHQFLVGALRQIDKAVHVTFDSESVEALASLRDVKFTKKYMQLLNVLNRCEVDLQYSWAEPRFQLGNSKSVTFAKTRSLVESIKARANDVMVEKERTVQGEFVRFNRRSGAWGLAVDEDSLVRGTIDRKEHPDQLDGLRVGARYTFTCVEKHTFGQAWKNEAPTLILRRIEGH